MTTEQIWNKQLEQRFYELHPHTLLRFEVHVAEHCNLSCRDCLHFSPLAKEEFLDIDEYRKDCARLSELFDSEVERLYLLGGEPLLHPNLVEIMKISREAFRYGQIGIITNGVLLPSMDDAFWAACKEYRIEVMPTKYPVTVDYDAVEKRAKQEGVFYHPHADKMPRMLRTPLSLKGDQPVERNYYACNHSNNCLTLRHGRLYTCEIAAHAHHLKKHFDLNISVSERNGIDIYAVNSPEELMEKLTKPIPFCRYCRMDDRDFWENWSVSQKDRYEWIRFEWSEADIQYLKQASGVYVYGAGNWGKQAVSRLLEEDVSVKAVLVTEREGNPASLCGVPVLQISNVGPVEREDVCLLAASCAGKTELERRIYEHGFYDVRMMSNFAWGYEDMERLRSAPEVFVYGAGKRAEEILPRLKREGVSVKTVLVTSAAGNPGTVQGIPVCALENLKSVSEESVCLIAIDHYSAQNEMQSSAYQAGFKRLIPLFEV